ncbi:MAG: YtcA family lipoprotein [Morganella morganii]
MMLKIVTGMLFVVSLSGCGYAPSVSFLGAFFPAWLPCIIAGVVLTLFLRVVLIKTGYVNTVACLPLVYGALTVIFTVLCWVFFFSPQ